MKMLKNISKPNLNPKDIGEHIYKFYMRLPDSFRLWCYLNYIDNIGKNEIANYFIKYLETLTESPLSRSIFLLIKEYAELIQSNTIESSNDELYVMLASLVKQNDELRGALYYALIRELSQDWTLSEEIEKEYKTLRSEKWKKLKE